jgi:membrane associated rhomboid family serine protease
VLAKKDWYQNVIPIPLRHENMEGRRWPVISIGLIIINFLVFFGTHWRMDAQNPRRAEVRTHILLLAAMHPELKMTPEVQDFAQAFEKSNPELWKQVASPNRQIADAWDARMRIMDDEEKLQGEMDSLSLQFTQVEDASILAQYGFIPAHPRPITYITNLFLHAGWLHIIFNMWFLWLAGVVLEDTWGRAIYPVFYLFAGAAASQFHAWLNPGSLVAAIGASGAVAALMGAFLVRFPTTKIQMMLLFGFGLRSYKFWASAYWLLPLWFAREVLSGTLFGNMSGVAHWAHVGGFLFGVMGALAIRYSGLEHHANKAIEAKVTWTADSAIVEATDQMNQGKLDQAVATLQNHIASKPDSIEAHSLLPQLHWRKNDVPKYQQAMIKLCQLHLKAHEHEAAWQDYHEYTNSGGDKLPASLWLELCRSAESQQHFDVAVEEYDKLARTYPAERQSLLAFMAAGRLSLKKLHRPAEALRYYQAAAASPVPHLDWESNINGGIQEAQKALSGAQIPVGH